MITFKTTIKDAEARTAIKNLKGRLANTQKPLAECGLILMRSIAKNFKAGGRPVRWNPSLRASKSGGQTLVKTARLKNSISMQVSGKTLRVGTSVAYARIHQLGGTINKNATVKSHLRLMTKAFGKPIKARKVLVKSHRRQMDTEIKARPYLLIQAEDYRVFNRIFGNYLTS